MTTISLDQNSQNGRTEARALRAPLLRRFFLFVKQHPLLFVALCILVTVTLMSLFAGLIAPYSPKYQNL